MNAFFTYIIESSIVLSFFLIIYQLFLRRETFFKWNRIYLIFSSLASLFIPLFNINWNIGNIPDTYYILLSSVSVSPNGNAINEQAFSTINLLGIAYLFIGGIILLLFTYRLSKLLFIIKTSEKKNIKKAILCLSKKTIAPSSFLNFIIMSEDSYKDQSSADIIINHEHHHIKDRHSYDLIMVSLMAAFFWINPFIWLLQFYLREVHEYIADNGTLNQGYDLVGYTEKLIDQNLGFQFILINNHFNHSLIFRRIKMITKNKSGSVARLKYLLVLPATMAALIVFAGKIDINQPDFIKASPEITKENTIPGTDNDTIYKVVEEIPRYPGGEKARVEFIVKNVKYPEDARKEGKEGTVYVTYTIEKDGSISNAKVLRGVCKSLNEEALRVIKLMPAWKPGMQDGKAVRVQFNMPIKFSLSKKTEKKEKDIELPPGVKIKEVK